MKEEELSQNINYSLDCSMKPGCCNRIPDWLEFPSKEQALKYGEQAEVSVFLKAEAIFLLFDGSKVEDFYRSRRNFISFPT